MLTTIAPSRSAANAAMTYCGQLGSITATRSPLPTPSRTSAPASRSQRDLISRNVSVAPRNAVAGASGISTAVVASASYNGRPGYVIVGRTQ